MSRGSTDASCLNDMLTDSDLVADAAYVPSKLDVDDSFVNRGLYGCLGRAPGSTIPANGLPLAHRVFCVDLNDSIKRACDSERARVDDFCLSCC